LDNIKRQGLTRWSQLHGAIVKADLKASKSMPAATLDLYEDNSDSDELHRLEGELNSMVNEALDLQDSERWLISDLVHVRLELIQGKIGSTARKAPSLLEMRSYCEALKAELDSFIEVASAERYIVEVINDDNNSMIALRRATARPLRQSIAFYQVDSHDAKALRRIHQGLLRKHSQWLYFERALRCYADGTIYIFKPMQYLRWLKSQALIDAGEIIADTAGGGMA
jgi:hypothetical protein